jgi:protein TonB
MAGKPDNRHLGLKLRTEGPIDAFMHSSPFPLRALLLGASLLALPVCSLRANETTEPPVPVRTVAPDVPLAFSRSGADSGLVTVRFLVDEKGNVQDATVEKSSDQELEQPALSAIRKWRFKPAKKGGVAVAVHVSIPIKFQVE